MAIAGRQYKDLFNIEIIDKSTQNFPNGQKEYELWSFFIT